MEASRETIKVGDTLIFRCDEYQSGDFEEFDGSVQYVNEDSVDVMYLSGYKSRNDTIPFSDVIAIQDLSAPRIKLKDAPFSGHLIEFKKKAGSENGT